MILFLCPGGLFFSCSQQRLPKQREKMDIIYDRNREGAWVLSTFIGNEYYKKVFYFYSKKEATQLFKSYVKGEN